jgi:hypothetical protein
MANGVYTLPQQLTSNVRKSDYIFNLGGNAYPAKGIWGERERVDNFISGATIFLPGASTEVKAEELLAGATDRILVKFENQVTQQVTERTELLSKLTNQAIKFSASDVINIGKNAEGKIIFMETGSAKAGLKHILNHAEEFEAIGIPKNDIASVVFEAATKGKQVGMQGTRPVFQVMYKGDVKNIAITIGDNGYIVGANPTTKF